MFFIYDLLLIIFGILSLPRLFIKKRLHGGILSRFYLKKNPLKYTDLKKIIWIHGASVGEISASKSLIENLRRYYPRYRILLSTITKTGYATAKGIAREDEAVIYFPFDLSFVVRHFICRIQPVLFILLETEIWPNFICACKEKNIPVLLLNGRISERAFKRYLLVRKLLGQVLDKIDLFCMQDETHKDRILKLGADKNRVFITGNIKFDVSVDADYVSERLIAIKEFLTAHKKRFLIAGSTHPKEEAELLGVFKGIRIKYPDLIFLIAPRHIERSARVRREAQDIGFKAEFYSGLNSETLNKADFIILDVMGELKYLYKLADIVFIGGSLVPHGGQNPIEPAVFAKPIIFGPHMENFKTIAGIFIDCGAALQVRDKEMLRKELDNLLGDPGRMASLGEKAEEIVRINRGATGKLIGIIGPYLNCK